MNENIIINGNDKKVVIGKNNEFFEEKKVEIAYPKTLQEAIKDLNERVEKLEELSAVQNNHIAYLQKRTRSFFDRFKFGRFKPLDITKESEIIKPKRKIFTLNDD